MDARELDLLVQRSRAGDRDAGSRLLREYYGVTFRMAYRLLGSREAAEDAVQEIFIRAWQNLPRFRGAARFSTWLHTIAVNQCLNHARKARRETRHTGRDPLESLLEGERPPVASPPNRDDDLAIAVQQSLEGLPEKLRVVLALRFFGDYSTGEIAAALELHPNTVRHRLNAALERLRMSLGDPEVYR